MKGASHKPAKNPRITVGRASITSIVGFTTPRNLGVIKYAVYKAAIMPSGIANSMAKKAAFSVPTDKGINENLDSNSSLPDDDCQIYSGSLRPSYHTRFHSALNDNCGC